MDSQPSFAACPRFYRPSNGQGFTLLELMVVVAIVAVLAAVAVPQYQQYLVRSRWAAMLTAAGAVQTAVADCLAANGGVTADCDTLAKVGVAADGDALPLPHGVLTLQPGRAGHLVITLRGNAQALGCQVMLTASTGSGGVLLHWVATNGGGCTRRHTGVG